MGFVSKVQLSAMTIAVALVTMLSLSYWFYQGKTMKFNRVKTFVDVPRDAIVKKTLENGMNIVVFKNSSVPKVLLQIAYDVGSYVEQSGERGLAHLIEHMIFKGTEQLSEVDIDRIARKYGATFNAWTSYDATSYYFETNKNNWKPFVSILADCMQNSRFEEQHLASELKAVIQELRMYKDAFTRAMMFKALAASLPAHHPYHTPIIGYKEDLLGIQAAQLREFYNKYYSPDRATLFVVGDVDPEEVMKLAESHFGTIVSKTKAATNPFPIVTKKVETVSIKIYEEVSNEIMLFYWLIPGMKDKQSQTISALEIILGQGEGSRLQRLLVDDKKVATSVSAHSMTLMEAGIFAIFVEPVLGKNDKCRALIQKELTTLINKGVSDYELERMVKVSQRDFMNLLQSYSSFVYQWLQTRLAGDNEYGIFDRINRFNDITSMDIRSFVNAELDPFLMNQIELLPIPETKKEMINVAKKISDEFDAEILKNHQRTAPLEGPKQSLTVADPEPLSFSFPKPDREIELENGLRVTLKRHGIWPLVSLHCQFKEAYYFTAAKEGILLELMMGMLQEGTTQYSKREIIDFFDLKGSKFETRNSGAHLAMMSTTVASCMERFLHILSNPVFPQEAFNMLKMIMIHDFESLKDNPREIASRLLKNSIYQNNDYQWTFDDAIETIKKTTVADLISLHHQYVNPSNMIMSVVGDFDLDEMEKTIKSVFNDWKAGSYKKITPPQPTFIQKQQIDHFMMRDQVILLMGQPSPVTLYDEDLVPLKLLSSIAFHSLGSRIYLLREHTGLFYNAFGAFAKNASRHHGLDYLGAVLSVDKVDEAEKMMREMMVTLADKGVDQYELDAARQLYLKELIDVVSTNGAVARMFCQLEALDLGFDYYDTVLNRVQSITVDELNAIAKKYSSVDNMARIRVGRVGKKADA